MASLGTVWLRKGVDQVPLELFNCSNALLHSSSQVWIFVCTKKYGRHLSADLEMDLLSAAILPVFFVHVSWWFMSIIAQVFSMFASIPLSKNIKPKNLPNSTPKAHFTGLSFILYYRRMAKASRRSSTRLESRSFCDESIYFLIDLVHSNLVVTGVRVYED